MQTGAGVQTKILEAMALGALNITTTLGGTPIVGRGNYQYLIMEDNPQKMATIINDVYLNPLKYTFIKAQCREFIKKHYTWDVHEEKYLSIFHSLYEESSENHLLGDLRIAGLNNL